MKKNFMHWIFVLLVGLSFASCDHPSIPQSTAEPSTAEPTDIPQPTSTTTPSVPPEPIPITFTTIDDIELSGTFYGDGRVAVILAHQGVPGTDQTSWQPFAQVLAEHGFTALTFDFRGMGQSDGVLDQSLLIYDIEAAIDLLHKEGYDKIACVGASMGGTACLRAALDHQPFIGVVVFASTKSLGQADPDSRTSIEYRELSGLNIPKLFLTASEDRYKLWGVVKETTKMYDFSPEPKELHIFEGMTEHGTELFQTEVGDELTNLLLEFLTGLME